MKRNIGIIYIGIINKEIEKFLQIKINGKSIYYIFNEKLKWLISEITKTPTSIMTYLDDYEIILGFEEYRKRKGIPIIYHNIKTRKNLRAFISFASAFQRIYYSNSNVEIRRKILELLKKGLNGGSRLFPFQHEIETFVHLNLLHFEVEWFDGRNGINYEFSAQKNGVTFAIECKSLARYAGSPIISEAANEFNRQFNWTPIKEKITNHCIILFHFDGKLMPKGGSGTHSPESLLQDFYTKFESNHPDISINYISPPTKMDRRWLATKFVELQNQYPTGYIVYPISLPVGEHAIFIALLSREKSNYIDKMEEQLEKAIKQVKGDQPAVIYLYPEGATSIDLENTKYSLYTIIHSKLSQSSQPLMCCVRGMFKATLHSNADVYFYYNKDFEPFYPFFQAKDSDLKD